MTNITIENSFMLFTIFLVDDLLDSFFDIDTNSVLYAIALIFDAVLIGRCIIALFGSQLIVHYVDVFYRLQELYVQIRCGNYTNIG